MFVYSYYKFLKYHVDFSVLFLKAFSAFSSLFFFPQISLFKKIKMSVNQDNSN